jgi:hypothetical protein
LSRARGRVGQRDSKIEAGPAGFKQIKFKQDSSRFKPRPLPCWHFECMLARNDDLRPKTDRGLL